MADKYLTVRILEDGELGFGFVKCPSLDYSFNGGNTWDGTLTNDNNTIIVTNGQEISFKKGNITSNDNSASGPLRAVIPTNYGNFFSNCQFEVFGNAMSIIDSENFANTNTIHGELKSLFSNCTKLVNAENLILPVRELGDDCYSDMFNGCTSLTTPPKLPAMTLANRCYYNMFNGCTSLTTAPELPATLTKPECYASMFDGCTSLETAPVLPATSLSGSNAYSCYHSMFKGCTKLKYVKCLAVDTSGTGCIYLWLDNVAENGTFVCAPNTSNMWSGSDGYGNRRTPASWTIVEESN